MIYDNALFSFAQEPRTYIQSASTLRIRRGKARNSFACIFWLIQGSRHTCYRLFCCSLFRTPRILDIDSGEPEPLRITLFITNLSTPKAIAHSTWVLYFFRYCFRAACSSLVSLTLLRFLSGIIACVSIFVLHLLYIVMMHQTYVDFCVLRTNLRIYFDEIFRPFFEKFPI